MKTHPHSRTKHPLHLTGLAAVLLTLPAPAHAQAEGTVRVWTESAPTPAGPWSNMNPYDTPLDSAGAMLVPTLGGRHFFRTQIANVANDVRAEVEVSALPAEITALAQEVLELNRARSADPESWPEDAMLSPVAIPVFDGAQAQRHTAAFIEFKVTRPRAITPAPAPLILFQADDAPPEDLGFILVSLTEDEVPVPQFATQGPTPSESLAELARTPSFRMARFGGDFWAAENAAGALLANLGAHPWRPDPAMAARVSGDMIWEGDDDLGHQADPPDPEYAHNGDYESYAAFKTDFQTNPVFIKLRERRALRARSQWQTARGEAPPVVQLPPGESAPLLPGAPVSLLHFDTETEARIADVSTPAEGGVVIQAVAEGEGILEVLSEGQLFRFVIQIGAAAAPDAASDSEPFVPGWHRTYEKFVGGYANQPKYAQMRDSTWDGPIGCGANAWATLLAWWERERSNHLAFGSNFWIDAPAEYTKELPKNRLKPVVKALRDAAGGIYSPANDSFATEPWNMHKGPKSVTYAYALPGWLSRSWKMRWADFAQTLGGGAPEVRDAVKANYCAVVGLGNMWHYAVAYGYTVDSFKLAKDGPAIAMRRWLRCNMCWGPGDKNAHWRDYYDVFFSSRFKLKVNPSAPAVQPTPAGW